jgi:hypothetical protein
MRKKECYTSGEIAHIWAHQKAENGRVSGNVRRMSFDGTRFYSYRTAIANIIKAKGKSAFVVDCASFSNTTSGHQSAVRSAIRNLGQAFFVHCGSYGQTLDFTPAQLRDLYLAEYRDNETHSRHKAKAASQYLHRVSRLRNAIEVCQYFGLGVARLQAELAKQREQIDAATTLVKSHEEKCKARRELKWERKRIARQQCEAAQIAQAIKTAEGDLSGVEDLRRAFGQHWNEDYRLLESRPDLVERVKAEAARRKALSRQDWINGVPYAEVDSDEPVALRASDGDMETSRGSRVPLPAAHRAFQFALKHRAAGWHRNGDQFEVGHYHLDAVNEQGVVAGCHRIGWDEIERFAKSQGWI